VKNDTLICVRSCRVEMLGRDERMPAVREPFCQSSSESALYPPFGASDLDVFTRMSSPPPPAECD